MKDLVESIAKALVDHPEHVQVKTVEGEQVTVLRVSDVRQRKDFKPETLQRTIPQRISTRLRRRFQPQISVSDDKKQSTKQVGVAHSHDLLYARGRKSSRLISNPGTANTSAIRGKPDSQ
jgi:hypothetical protein